MKTVSLIYSNEARPSGTARGPVTGRLFHVEHGATVDVSEQDAKELLADSDRWSEATPPEPELPFDQQDDD